MPGLLKLTSVSEALKIVNSVNLSKTLVEKIPVERGLGRVLAEDIISPEDVPGFYRSTMDGYAVRAKDTFGASEGLPAYLDVAGEVIMGSPAEVKLGQYQAVRVATGAMLPPGADAVVMVEYVEDVGPGQVGIVRPVAPGENVVSPGEDIKNGEMLLTQESVLRPQDLGAITGVGIVKLTVYKKPRVALLSTGDELVPPSEKVALGQVRDINTYALAGLVEQSGGEAVFYGIIQDEYQAMHDSLAQALKDCDMVLLSGGSSVGEKDMTPQVINAFGPPGVIFHGVAVKPGKPTIFGMVKQKPVFGLPGHPVSAMILFHVLVKPVLKRLAGMRELEKPLLTAKLARNIASAAGRRDYIRVELLRREGCWWAEPVLGKSGLISTMVKADGLVELPDDWEGIASGQEVQVHLFN